MKSERKVPFFLIWRYIKRSNKWTLGLIIFLLSIAFINLVFINSLFNGVVVSSQQQLVVAKMGNISMTPARGSDYIENQVQVVKQIDAVTGVKASAPETVVEANVDFRGARQRFNITGIDPSKESQVINVSRKMISGTYLKDGDVSGVLIGADVGGGLDVTTSAYAGIKPGDRVTIILGDASREFVVRGIFKTKFQQTDDEVFITRGALGTLRPDLVNKATTIIIKTVRTGGEAVVVGRLKAAGITGTFFTWEQASVRLKTITNSFNTINALLTVVGFFIAAVTIFIIIYVDITHKRNEIGILRAIGVRSYLIGSTYVLQTVVYSFCGVALGTALFWGIIVPYFQAYPFAIPIGDVTLAVSPADFISRGMAVIGVAIISGLIPVIIALRTRILDAILGR